MSKNDPFGFDISAAKDKKRKTKGRRGMSGAFETSTRTCEREGCDEPGQYRAPKNPRNLDDYFWFCKEHVRDYNANWNYFHLHRNILPAMRAKGVSDEQIALMTGGNFARMFAGR